MKLSEGETRLTSFINLTISGLSRHNRRTITPASFEKENIGRAPHHGVQHTLPFRHHPSSSTFELPLSSIPEMMNYPSHSHAPPLQTHSGAVGVAQPQLQVVSANSAPVHLDHQLASAVSASCPQSYHHHSTGVVSYSSVWTLYCIVTSLSLSRVERAKLPIKDSL